MGGHGKARSTVNGNIAIPVWTYMLIVSTLMLFCPQTKIWEIDPKFSNKLSYQFWQSFKS